MAPASTSQTRSLFAEEAAVTTDNVPGPTRGKTGEEGEEGGSNILSNILRV